MTKITCDQAECSVAVVPNAYGWPPSTWFRLNQGTTELHFCSAHCLARWADQAEEDAFQAAEKARTDV